MRAIKTHSLLQTAQKAEFSEKNPRKTVFDLQKVGLKYINCRL